MAAVELTLRPILGMSFPMATPGHAASTTNAPMKPGRFGSNCAKTVNPPA